MEGRATRGEIEQLWSGALEAAVLAADAVRVYRLNGVAPGRSAAWFEPHSEVFGDREFPLSRDQLRDINATEQRGKHRICVFAEARPPVLAAKLRHELEHARQWDRGGGRPLFELVKLLHEVDARKFGGLAQSGRAYNLMPTERDANAAAARFVRTIFPAAVIEAELSGPDAVLFRSSGPALPETVGRRMLAQAAIWPESVMQLADERGLCLEDLLRSVAEDGDEIWGGLRSDPRFAELREDVEREAPTSSGLDGLGEEEIAAVWGRFADLLLGARAYAESLPGMTFRGPRGARRSILGATRVAARNDCGTSGRCRRGP